MSGGSMDYLFCRVENDANFKMDTPLRRAFKAHLAKVATALHDIEWVDSGDWSPGDEVEAIEACLSPTSELEQVTKEAKEAFDVLGKIMLDGLKIS